jgi:hypothetical protein
MNVFLLQRPHLYLSKGRGEVGRYVGDSIG